MEELQKRCEALERDLARHVPEVELQRRLRAADRQAVALSLPQDAVLVDFVRFNPFRFEATGTEPRWDAPRYLAFILPAGKPDEVQMVDLGEAESIDAMIATFREHVIGPTRGDGAEAAEDKQDPLLDLCRQLHSRLFLPLKKALGDGNGRRLFLSPDG